MRSEVSIMRRLAVAIALILMASGSVVAFAAYAYGRQAAEAAYDRLLAGAAFQIAQSVEVSADRLTVDLPVSAFELLALAPDDRVVYRVVDRTGATLTGYDDLAPPPAHASDLVFYSSRHGGETMRLAATRRRFAEQAYSGDVEILVGHTTRARDALAADIATKAMLIVAVAGVVIAALTVFAVRSSLAPLARIEAALANRDPKDLSPLDVRTPREVEALVGGINRFMDRLQRRMAGMQTLIADTAHQLRTPIAALRAQAELASEESDPAALRAIAETIRRRASGLGRLADQLLNQALVVHRADALPDERLDLREVAMRVADETDGLMPDCDLRLSLGEDPVRIAGDSFSLAEAAKNLLNNALRYGAEPVSLTVSADWDQGLAEIAVLDAGQGIAEADWADSGRRFSRAADRRSDGAGIGLAIVNAVAASHGGRLVFSRAADGRFRAALQVPLAGVGT
ncbi:MAG: sensor histidine kinase N-terminal domain-containing protein [Rhizobiaceae bacterium]|nr:sensor histidine kinase N-terminal domain-containing protein [Rhizobiaceae bacterium]